MRERAHLLAHIQNTHSQYNLPEIGKKLAYQANRDGVAERFAEPSVQKSIAVDLALIDHYDRLLTELELYIVTTAKAHDANAFYRLRSVPVLRYLRIGKILALVILYEIDAIQRFPRVQDFVSYPEVSKGGSSSVPRNPPASVTAPRGRRSAMLTSHGPSPKPPYSSCETTPRARSIWLGLSASTARP
jgi:hypothetical protein